MGKRVGGVFSTVVGRVFSGLNSVSFQGGSSKPLVVAKNTGIGLDKKILRLPARRFTVSLASSPQGGWPVGTVIAGALGE